MDRQFTDRSIEPRWPSAWRRAPAPSRPSIGSDPRECVV